MTPFFFLNMAANMFRVVVNWFLLSMLLLSGCSSNPDTQEVNTSSDIVQAAIFEVQSAPPSVDEYLALTEKYRKLLDGDLMAMPTPGDSLERTVDMHDKQAAFDRAYSKYFMSVCDALSSALYNLQENGEPTLATLDEIEKKVGVYTNTLRLQLDDSEGANTKRHVATHCPAYYGDGEGGWVIPLIDRIEQHYGKALKEMQDNVVVDPALVSEIDAIELRLAPYKRGSQLAAYKQIREINRQHNVEKARRDSGLAERVEVCKKELKPMVGEHFYDDGFAIYDSQKGVVEAREISMVMVLCGLQSRMANRGIYPVLLNGGNYLIVSGQDHNNTLEQFEFSRLPIDRDVWLLSGHKIQGKPKSLEETEMNRLQSQLIQLATWFMIP